MENRVINFMALAKPTALVSILLVVISLGTLAYKGLTLGLDFTGGTAVEVEYAEAPAVRDIMAMLAKAGYDKVVVQTFGADTSILIRLQQTYAESLGDEIVAVLQQSGAGVKLVRAEFVGAQVGEELKEQGGLGLLVALGTIMVYIAFRFQFKFAVGAVTALIHDVIITIGVFAVLGWEFDLNVLAAILAIIGYSLNDTIVVFDRIRENFRKLRKETPVMVINISLTETLSRTIVTGLTTLLVLIALYLFGGEALAGFSKALIVGIVIGTYSSVYIASSITLLMKVSSEDLMISVKESEELDDRP
jgi:preprotein translocase subunit SecF